MPILEKAGNCVGYVHIYLQFSFSLDEGELEYWTSIPFPNKKLSLIAMKHKSIRKDLQLTEQREGGEFPELVCR
jgi:hypothetical protein